MSTSRVSSAHSFVPSDLTLKRYATFFAQFVLRRGAGVNGHLFLPARMITRKHAGMRYGETVRLVLPEFALPLYLPLQAAILRAGDNLVLEFRPEGADCQLLEMGNDCQLTFFLDDAQRELAARIDHSITLRGGF